MTSASKQLHNLLFLVSYLSGKPGRSAPIAEVARKLGVTKEEVVSYVNTLLLCGKPPFTPGDYLEITVDGGRIRLELDQSLGKPVRFTAQEALAVSLALSHLRATAAAGVAAVAEAALAKIGARLSEDVREEVRAVEHRFAIESEDGAGERLAILERAAEERRVVEIEYFTKSRGELATRRVHPYLLAQHVGWWYVIAHDEAKNALRTFKLERVRSARLTTERFTVDPSFDPAPWRAAGEQLFVSEGGEVQTARIRFHPPLSTLLASKKELAGDGTAIREIRYVSPEGLASYVLGFGPAAEVLEPADLRRAVADAARRALAPRA